VHGRLLNHAAHRRSGDDGKCAPIGERAAEILG
jgi:hypothetical protein